MAWEISNGITDMTWIPFYIKLIFLYVFIKYYP